MSITHLI